MATLRDYITRLLAENPNGMIISDLCVLLDEDEHDIKHNLNKMWHKNQVAFRDDKWYPISEGESTGTSTVVEEMRLRKMINEKFQNMDIYGLRKLAVIIEKEFK